MTPSNGPTGTPFAVGDRIIMKKPHPCGGREWVVYRIGADIGVKCESCDRRVMLTRREMERRIKQHLPNVGESTPEPDG